MTLRRATAVLVFAASAAAIALSGRLAGDYRIDEVHKISETHFLRLIEHGDFRNPAWLLSAVERSNPAIGKVLFGLAIQIAGEPLPADLRVARLTESGRRLPPPETDAQYRRWLRAVRTLVMIVTATTATVVFVIGAGASDTAGGVICSLLFMTAFLTEAFAATAVFDPLLTCFIALAGAFALRIRHDVAAALAAAVASALAFDIRVTGLLAIAGVTTAFALQRRFHALILAAVAFVFFATLLNPFYWVPGPEPFPLRIVSRYTWQFRDLRALLAEESTRQEVLGTAWSKLRFAAEYFVGDWNGIAAFLGIACLGAAAIFAPRIPPDVLATCAWAAAIVTLLVLWIPIAFPRYLLAAAPPLAVLGGTGWRFAATGLREAIHWP